MGDLESKLSPVLAKAPPLLRNGTVVPTGSRRESVLVVPVYRQLPYVIKPLYGCTSQAGLPAYARSGCEAPSVHRASYVLHSLCTDSSGWSANDASQHA